MSKSKSITKVYYLTMPQATESLVGEVFPAGCGQKITGVMEIPSGGLLVGFSVTGDSRLHRTIRRNLNRCKQITRWSC